MKYLGGKSKTCERIASYVNQFNMPYREPFCGGCWVTQHVTLAPRIASDIHPELIAMWQAAQNGWQPPDDVSEEMYAAAKAGEYDDQPWLKGFIGFGCSWGAKWFGGYAREGIRGDRNYALESKYSVLTKVDALRNVTFECSDYRDIPLVKDHIFYCDPPYNDTTEYSVMFDSNEFWNWVRIFSCKNIVLVSEYAAPSDFITLMEMPIKLDVRSKVGAELRIEKVFAHESLTLPPPIRQERLEW